MKKFVIALAIVGFAVLSVLVWKDNKEKDKTAVEYAKMEQELIPLNVKKRELEKQLEDMDLQVEKQLEIKGTATMVFTELKKDIYTKIYPIMETYEYKGVLALSSTQFPGEDGCMSVSHFKRLIKAGWSYCVMWEEGSDWDQWHGQLQEKLKRLKLKKSTAIYFPNGTYKKEMQSDLARDGYGIAVHHGEEQLSFYSQPVKEETWYPGACGMQGQSPKTKLKKAVGDGTNIVYTIGFSLQDELYEEETFKRMLDEFRMHEDAKELLVTDFDGAQKYHLDIQEQREESKGQSNKGRAALLLQIQQIENRIDELYEQYTE